MQRLAALGAARQAALVASLETAAIVAYAAGVGVAATNSSGTTTGSAPVVLVMIYLAFAAGAGLIAWGLWTHRALARTPMMMMQVFGLVVAYPMIKGGGAAAAGGVVVAAVSALGLWLALRPSMDADLRG